MPALADAACLALVFLTTPDPGSAQAAEAPALVASTPLWLDRFDRYQAEVTLNGQRPFRFIIDTGSAYSVLSERSAGRLALKPDPDVSVDPADGSALKGVLVESYRSDVFDRRNEPMILYPAYAGGVMGMRAFTAERVELDFVRRLLRVAPSGPVPAGFVAVHGSLNGTSNLIVDVVVDGVRAKALIDTGARYTVGNPMLQAALGYRSDDPRLRRDVPEQDMTTQQVPAYKTRLGQIAIGEATLSKPTVQFAALPIFHRVALDGGPALILGIDQLSRLQAMAIDYPRVELQVRQKQQ